MEHMCILGCPAGSDRNDRGRKLVHFTYKKRTYNLLIKGVIVYLPSTMDIPVPIPSMYGIFSATFD